MFEVTCPECWSQDDVDNSTDQIICQECGYEYYPDESVGD